MCTRNKIIEEIYNEKSIERCLAKYSKRMNGFIEDVVQDIYMMIIELPEDKLLKLYNDNELTYYILTICRNQCVNKYSTSNKKYQTNVKKMNYDEYAKQVEGGCNWQEDDEEFE